MFDIKLFKRSLVFIILVLMTSELNFTSCTSNSNPQSINNSTVIDSSQTFYPNNEIMIGNSDTIYEIYSPLSSNFVILKFSLDNKEYTIIFPRGSASEYRILNIDTSFVNSKFYKK